MTGRVFFDTNVLAAGYGTRGFSLEVIDLTMRRGICATGEGVLAELKRKLQEKFRLPAMLATDAEQDIRRGGHIEPRPAAPARDDRGAPLPAADEDDAWVLASAVAAHADVLCTGDRDFLDARDEIRRLFGIEVLRPREVYERLQRS